MSEIRIEKVTVQTTGSAGSASGSATTPALRGKLLDVYQNAAIANAYDYFALDGPLTVSIAQCDALTPAVTAYVRYEAG